jgi:predicted nucleic acid-binding protein
MSVEFLMDANVLIYSVSRLPEEAAKRDCALRIIEMKDFGLSGQVLAEFYNTVTRKQQVRLSPDEARKVITELSELPTIPVDRELVIRGSEIAERYQISYWDGAILAAAERLGATTVYSEDLNHGQQYGSVTVENPFTGL